MKKIAEGRRRYWEYQMERIETSIILKRTDGLKDYCRAK